MNRSYFNDDILNYLQLQILCILHVIHKQQRLIHNKDEWINHETVLL